VGPESNNDLRKKKLVASKERENCIEPKKKRRIYLQLLHRVSPLPS
jgi:hypothetical protein